MSTFANSEDPDEMQHNVLHFIWVCTVWKGKKDIQTKEYNICFENYNLKPLYMFNGLCQVYCIEPEGINKGINVSRFTVKKGLTRLNL